MVIQVTPNTYTPAVGEIITVTGSSDTVEDIVLTLVNRDNNVAAGQVLIPMTLEIFSIQMTPSDYGVARLRCDGVGTVSGATATFNLDIATAPPPPPPPEVTGLQLSASNTNPAVGAQVAFTIQSTPVPATFTATLKAYMSGVEKASWTVNIVNGIGAINLVPSVIGATVQWAAYSGTLVSNSVTTTVSGTPPPDGFPWLLVAAGVLATVGVALVVLRKR